MIFYRILAAAIIVVVLGLWIYPASTAFQQMTFLVTAGLFLLTLLAQIALTIKQVSGERQWAFLYASDTVLTSLLVFASGGIFSPFSMLYGLVIIACGTHARRMLPVMISVLACFGYLAAVYGEAGITKRISGLDTAQSLHALLQVSVFLLVGGVMAYIARRHASLHATSSQAVRQHRKLKDMHDHIMAAMREGVIVLDKSLHVSDMNDAAQTLLGTVSVASLLAYPALAGFFARPEAASFQCDYQKHGDTWLLAVQSLSSDDDAAWLLTVVDITDVRRLEQELMQQEKMAVLGKMAAMLAHEIRNPIQTIDQGLEIMAKHPDNGIKLRPVLHDEIMRLNRLVGIMLEYSKPLHPTPELTHISELIQASIHQCMVKKQQQIHCQCQVNKLWIDADHFRLVLDNLLSNALANSLDQSTIDVHMHAGKTSWALQVSNAGEIPASMRESIFEPFVSGRSSGIGLGLATIKQVCKANGWLIDVDCAAGMVRFQIKGAIQDHQEAWADERAMEATNG